MKPQERINVVQACIESLHPVDGCTLGGYSSRSQAKRLCEHFGRQAVSAAEYVRETIEEFEGSEEAEEAGDVHGKAYERLLNLHDSTTHAQEKKRLLGAVVFLEMTLIYPDRGWKEALRRYAKQTTVEEPSISDEGPASPLALKALAETYRARRSS